MQSTVRLLTELQDAITPNLTGNYDADYYYRRGQLDLIDNLIRTIAEGALNDRVGAVQGGIELLSAEES